MMTATPPRSALVSRGPRGVAAPAPRRRARGSVLILVVVVIVLMAMMGAAYLQMARVQRVQDGRAVDNIDQVLQSVIDEIKRQLKRDVIAENGKFFDPASNIENRDFPWTDTSQAEVAYIDPVTNATINIEPARPDDRWLSYALPELQSGPLRWRKITNLTGYYIRSTSGTSPNDLGAAATIASDPVTNNTANNANSDSNLDVVLASTNTRLVDSNGDGYGDSRWERAPLALLSGNEYFMAVQIIDASSLINLYAATALTGDGTAPGNQIAGYFPTGLDLSRLCARHASPPPSWRTLVDNVFTNLRSGNPGTIQTGPGNVGTLVGITNLANYWAPASYGPGQARAWLGTGAPGNFGASAPGNLGALASGLLELRWKGGVNRAATTTAEETQMGALLDTPAYTEASATPIPNANNHFVGTNPGTLGSNTFSSLRHLLTTVSGHAAWSPNHNDMNAGAYTLKQDLMYQFSGAGQEQTRADAFNTRLRRVLGTGGGWLGGATNDAAAQLAAAMVEYADTNGKPSVGVANGGTTWYGLEVLPFLREVYIQAGYTAPPPSGPLVGRNYAAAPGSQAIAIEIGNPFDRPFRLGGANDPAVRVAIVQGASSQTFNLTIPSPLQPRNSPSESAPADREHLIYVINPRIALDEDGVKSSLVADIGIAGTTNPVQTVSLGANDPFASNGGQITVELQVQVPGGAWVAYDRLTHSSLSMPANVDTAGYSGGGTVPQPKNHGHLQKSLRRAADGINYLSNLNVAIAGERRYDAAAAVPWPQDGFRSDVDALNNDTKGIAADPKLQNFQFAVANHPFLSVAEIGWIPVLGFSNAATGGSIPEVIAARAASQLFLDFGAAAVGSSSLNHAQMVLDEFTTLSPRYDGVDNDGDGDADDADNAGPEQLVFGTMNVNTAPHALLAYALPWPSPISGSSTGLAQMGLNIINARNTVNGFRSVGHLLSAGVADLPTDPSTLPDDAWNLYPVFESTLAPASGGQDARRYADTGSAEARMRRLQFLTQAFSTRSDIYIASIVVKGYRSGAYNAGGVQESGQIIVVFDRSRLRSNDDDVEVLAVFDYSSN